MVFAALALAGCVVAPVNVERAAAVPVVAPVPASVPAGMQYLYGSGEGAAISMQAWQGLVAYVAQAARVRPRESVVLAGDATLAAPRFVPCGAKPLAAVFDVDETVLLNLGFEADEAAHPGRTYDAARWERWERTGTAAVAPVPGARAALDAIRRAGVTVVFNSNRTAATASFTEAALTGAGLGPARHGETLFLKGDDATGSREDGRRQQIAARYCVVAMGGDQLGDFSDLFNTDAAVPARRAAVTAPAIAAKWGTGWFVMPNPVYGTALQGTIDQVYPRDRRWSDAQ